MTPTAEQVVTVTCAACGEPFEITWTKSAEGWRLYHGRCWETTR